MSDDDKTIGFLLVLVVAVLFLMGLMRAQQQQCAARQCPLNYTPTLTRDGCVCLMKAK